MKRCPHANIVHCPLYIALHDARLVHLGCDNGAADPEICAVGRGVEYAENVGRLIALDPRTVAECRWREEVAGRRAQRDRNMRQAGLH